MKAITQREYLERFQLMIRSRPGVYRNSWSHLLTEFRFNTFKEGRFGLLSQFSVGTIYLPGVVNSNIKASVKP